MGQISTVNKLPKIFYDKIVKMLKNPAITRLEIVALINKEAGKKLITKSALNRFIKNNEKITGTKRGRKPPTTEESLTKIAKSLERLVFYLENQA